MNTSGLNCVRSLLICPSHPLPRQRAVPQRNQQMHPYHDTLLHPRYDGTTVHTYSRSYSGLHPPVLLPATPFVVCFGFPRPVSTQNAINVLVLT